MPDGYSGALPLFLLDPAVVRQMLLSLRLNVALMLENLLPWLFVQACLLGGLFTALRVQRMRCAVLVVGPDPEASGRTQGTCGVPARFPPDGDPSRLRWVLFLMALASLLLIARRRGCADPGPALLRNLFLRLSAGGCGGAGMHALCAHSGRAALYGALSAVLYALFPVALFFIGVADQALHFRSRLLKTTDSHKEG